MPPLDARTRAQLPDSAFAYIDSQGKRRLPINDASHVRNALARFNQVLFEDEAARDRARLRLLRAAQRHGVAPIGFISAQLQPQRRLPKGHVTFLLTDVERSTELLSRLGDEYPKVAATVRRIMRRAIRAAGGHEVDSRGDEFFAAFAEAPAALTAAVAIQRALAAEPWPNRASVRVRAALHSGRPTLTETGYVGLAVHAAARFCYCAHGGQIVLSGATHGFLAGSLPVELRLRSLGAYRFRGLREPEELYQVETEGLLRDFPPLRAAEPAS
jgi:class 3 adenylate cyclase